MPTESSIFDALTAVQQDVLQALVAGQSISAAAKVGGIHRSTVHLWTQKHPTFARALLAARHHRAELLLDELGNAAINTFRHILSDEHAPASVRLKAARRSSNGRLLALVAGTTQGGVKVSWTPRRFFRRAVRTGLDDTAPASGNWETAAGTRPGGTTRRIPSASRRSSPEAATR